MAEPRTAVLLKTYPKLSETFILEELLGLERAGIELSIFSLQRPTDDRVDPETARVRAPVSYVPPGGVGVSLHARALSRHPIRYLRALGRALVHRSSEGPGAFTPAVWLAAELRRADIGHLHAHFISRPATVADLASRLSGVPFSISAHAKDIYVSSPRSLRRKLGAAAFTVTCTEHNRAHLAALAPTGADVRRVHHGVRVALFGSPQVPGPPASTPLILAVGRLRAKKGFDLLVEACGLLRNEGRRFECRIIGYGPEEGALRARIERLGLADRVTLLGKLTRDEVIGHYREASVAVQPCRVAGDGDRDGIPNVLLEAMATGVPVVSTTVSGIPELIEHDVDGLLVEPDDTEALAAAISRLLNVPGLARRLARAGRETVAERFDADRSARCIAGLLAAPRVAYVLKGYPRLSEVFIASEIHRVERLGLPLRLFVLKEADETVHHDVVDRIVARPHHLPAVTSISQQSVGRWLAANLGSYGPILVRVARRRPIGLARACGMALAQSLRARRGRRLRKVHLKELFWAAAIADQVLRQPSLRHLHAHFCHGTTTVTWLAATITGRTFSFTAHAKDIYREDLNPAGLLERKLAAATFVATCTEANRRHLEAIHSPAAVHRIYHGLNDDFARLMERPAPPTAPRGSWAERVGEAGVPGRFEILSVGRLVPKKGLDTLVEATRILVDTGIEFGVRLVGEEGEHAPVLRGLVEHHGLGEHITFVPAMSQSDLLAEYRRADVFCLPCRVLADGDRDGIPNVLMEAMATGLPVVTTPISGIPELVEDRVNGLLVPPDDVDALAKALLELADDDELRARLSRAGVEVVRSRFDAWSETRAMVDLLTGSVAGGAAVLARPHGAEHGWS